MTILHWDVSNVTNLYKTFNNVQGDRQCHQYFYCFAANYNGTDMG